MVKACVENGANYIDISGEPQVCSSRKMLPSVKDLSNKYLFSMFPVSADVFEVTFCLLIYYFKMHYFKVHEFVLVL